MDNARFKLHKADNDARAAALQSLFRVVHEGADSQAALDDALASPHLAPVDRRLCTELLYGTLRRFLSLRAFIRNFLNRPEKIPQEMELTLILALYEMVFLRSPHHAAVGWAVSHIRNRFGRVMGGVGNAVLRKAQRSLPDYGADLRQSGCLRPPSETAGEDLPDWMERMWRENYGEAAFLALARAACLEPPAGLRLNRAAEGWESLRGELLADRGQSGEARIVAAPEDEANRHILSFSAPLPAAARRAVEQGRASRQSAAAAEVLNFFAPGGWPGPIWDCCAGRGGKTLSLLEQGIAVRLASDISSRRLDGLALDYARLGLSVPCPLLLRLDLGELCPDAGDRSGGKASDERLEERAGVFQELFGTILLDAPCSGLGTLSRRPEIRLRRAPGDIEKLAGLQSLMLKNLWPRLMPGGRLIYLTCTVSPAENEGQIAAFLASNPDALLGREFRTSFSSPLREFFYGAQLEKML
ncbi:MAG: hypothetical protein LBS65_04000 [Desulfovibrio sp.]|jgi:16S rRNA (cytosine967-C5)-methyltransferase|nr:hypothetical protein [Desulfovibrio sp.]